MKPPVPILYTIPNFITAGSGRAMLNIIERLDRSRFSPAVAISTAGGRLDQEVREMGIPLIVAPFTVHPRPYSTLPFRVRKAATPFWSYQFRLWHSFHYSDDYTEAMIARCAGARRWVFTKKNMGWGSRAWKFRSLFASGIAVQNTDMLERFFSSNRFRKKTAFVQRGVDTSRFIPVTQQLLGLRTRHFITSDHLVITVVAHLVPVKGHPTLLEALRGCPNTTLLIAGRTNDTGYYNELRSLIQQYNLDGRVHFLGAVSDIPSLHAETDIFVLPTWARWRMEGCPVALLEAMACGKACIATDIPGSRDLIEHERSGLLVPPENADALRAAINRLAHDSEFRDRLGKAARQRVLDHFTIEREVRQHEELYMSLLGLK